MQLLSSKLAHVAVGRKLALLAIVPILALVILASRTTVGHWQALRSLETYERVLPMLAAGSAFVKELEEEKRVSVAFLHEQKRAATNVSEKTNAENLSGARAATDSAARIFLTRTDALSGELPRVAQDGERLANRDLVALRSRIDTTRFSPWAADSSFQTIIKNIDEVYHRARKRAPTTELSEQTRAFWALSTAMSLGSDELQIYEDILLDTSSTALAEPGEESVLEKAHDRGVLEQVKLREFENYATPALKDQYHRFLQSSVNNVVAIDRRKLSYQSEDPRQEEALALLSREWIDSRSMRLSQLGELLDAQYSTMYALMTDEQQRVRRSLWRDMAIFLISLSIALLLTHAVRRSIISPLREVVQAANKLSQGEVDGTIRYRGSDEMAEVSSAFRTLHQTVTNLTGEIGRLNIALKQGYVSVRGDEGRFQGKWSEVVAGMNASLDEFESLHSKLRLEANRQASLRELGSSALEGLSLTRLMTNMAETSMPHLGADRCEIYCRDGDVWKRQAIAGRLAPTDGSVRLEARADINTMQAGTGITPALHADMDTALVTMVGDSSRQFGLIVLEYESLHTPKDKSVMLFAQALGQILTTAMQRQEAEQQLIYKAHHDALTGLANRTLFEQKLGECIAGLTSETRVAVLFLDLDRFKLVNDSYGHHVGDELLLQIAKRLSTALSAEDTVARFGGDEFAVCRVVSRNTHEVDDLSQRIVRVFDEPFKMSNRNIYVTTSIGATIGTPNNATSAQLLREADTAMYRAKQSGNTVMEYFSEELRHNVVRRYEIEHLLHVERNEISNVYQPIIDLRTGRAIGYEALARWAAADWGHVKPSEFIPVAEENGLIQELGEQLLAQACQEASHLEPGVAKPYVSVNVSVRQLERRDFPSSVQRVLETSALPPEALCLEVTEGAIMSDPDRVLTTLKALRALGIRLAVDDFGTGYSSFSYLTKLPVQIVKIDQSFVNDLGRTGPSNSVVTAMCSLGHKLGLKVVAEGVETDEQVNVLRTLGIDAAQGFVFGEPGPLPKLDQHNPSTVTFLDDALRGAAKH